MIKIYGICFLIFLAIWGIGVLFAYLGGFQKTSFSGPETKMIDGAKVAEQQKKISVQTKTERNKLMDDLEYERIRFNREQGKPYSKF